jgi:hypothetical protein
MYTHLADPLFIHDMTFEVGHSPFEKNPNAPTFHFKGKYEYKRTFHIGVNRNATDFYDLFNQRKRGMVGTKISFGNRSFWKYDNPHKIKQHTELAIYTGIESINDNIIQVTHPDFFVFQTTINSTNIRRAIGSIDKEVGSTWDISAMFFGHDLNHPELAGGLHFEWDGYKILKWPHNIFHLKLAAGYRTIKDDLEMAKFYLGGFGNRYLENIDVKQFRHIFRFPGIPIYSLATTKFGKIMLENNLPPLRLAWPVMGHHYLSHIDASCFSQGLLVDSPTRRYWINIGAQINIIFKHWYNLESTLSAGIAKAWSNPSTNWEWFVSYKILK